MAEIDDELTGRLSRILGDASQHYALHSGAVWLSANRRETPAEQQGWKIHISARPATLLETLTRAVPSIAAAEASFKVAATIRVLAQLNSGGAPMPSVGKAITIYPSAQMFEDLLAKLVVALDGLSGPRIVSDYQAAEGSVVYYRFGPFYASFRGLEDGTYEPVVIGPDGSVSSGVAGLGAPSEPWMQRPPTRGVGSVGAVADSNPNRLIAGRYRIKSGISRSAKGSVYRAEDLRTHTPVVIKQARAFVDEDEFGSDTRDSLRNEFCVLQALQGVDGVVSGATYFCGASSEYLVTNDAGSTDLRSDVSKNGTYAWTPRSDRSLSRTAQQLARVIHRVHERGVIVRDLAPKNIILSSAGDLTLIDFEISALRGKSRYGWTPGYSPSRQKAAKPADIADDYYSLGMTLFYLATGMEPIVINDTQYVNVLRTLEILRDICGRSSAADFVIRALTSDSVDARRSIFDSLRNARAMRTDVMLGALVK